MNGPPRLEVRDASAKGRGVFALEPISEGQTLFVDHYVECPNDTLQPTPLYGYAFWLDDTSSVIVLGLSSLVNHSDEPNAKWRLSTKDRTLTMWATKAIAAGEEIVHDYGPCKCEFHKNCRSSRFHAAKDPAPSVMSFLGSRR